MADYDDGAYYEVQLNNKQLVFFFMAALAIAVVVFLCGVMVGRGVRDASLAAASNDIASGLGQRSADSPRAAIASQSKLDYASRLESEEPPAKLEPVRSESPETTVRQASVTKPPPPERAVASAPPASARGMLVGQDVGPFTIQVVALKTEGAARSLLSKLEQKNYRAYLEVGGEGGLHRVRVGRFATRAEAEEIARKLRDEEKFKPYVTQ